MPLGGPVLERSRPAPEDEALLSKRAQALARLGSDEASRAVHATVVVVSLGEEQLGIPARQMRCVAEGTRITALPGSPTWLAGLALVRGELISVVHFSHWLGRPSKATNQVIAVLASVQGSIGVLIDSVIGFRDVFADELSEGLLRRAGRERRPISAVTTDLLALVDLDRFFGDPSLILDSLRSG